MARKNLRLAGLALLPILVTSLAGLGQAFLGSSFLYQYSAGDPIVIGDYIDPFRYDGEMVRPLEGEGFLGADPYLDEGLLIVELQTTEASGPIMISEGVALEGLIRLEMDRFVGSQSFMQGGIAEYIFAHGDTGVMAAVLPELFLELAGWGMIDIYVDEVLLYEDLVGHFMLGERLRRGPEEAYAILRSSGNLIYAPDLEDKTGFTFSGERELHVFVANSMAGIESAFEQDLALHINLLLHDGITLSSAGGGGSTTTDPEDPEDPSDPEDPGSKGGPKGNNGIGNGEDPQPPGNPKQND